MFSSLIHFDPETAAPVRVTLVRTVDRIADAVAASFIVAGVGLFLFARQSLTSLANGTYRVAAGSSYVARADVHAAQSKLGLWLAALGLAIAIASALSHLRAGRRRTAREALAKADA